MPTDPADTFARLIPLLHARGPGGAPDVSCRIGAILALETLAEGCVEQGDASVALRIMETLLAWLRAERPAAEAVFVTDPGHAYDLPKPRADVQWALTVLARRGPIQRAAEAQQPLAGGPSEPTLPVPDPSGDDGQPAGFPFRAGWQPDLRGINLQRADLTGAWLVGAQLDDVPMEGARLAHARLTRAALGGTRLAGAWLRDAVLSRAVLVETDLRGASLLAADLDGVTLSAVLLDGTDLTGANLRGAQIVNTPLDGADLTGVRR